MAIQISDKQLNDAQNLKDGEFPFYQQDFVPDSQPDKLEPESPIDSKTVNGIPAVTATAAAPNKLVATDNSGKLPTSIIPTITGKIVQVVVGSTGTNATKSGTIPDDNTIPQNTEGDLLFSASITPTSATSKLYVLASVQLDTTLRTLIGSLCWDQGANALAAFRFLPTTVGANAAGPFTLTTVQTAGTTGTITFSVRAGNDSASTYYINADQTGAARFGGVLLSSITIFEITQ